ncbi:MAG: hypothetical protein J0L75_11560 [Spirochaetes bacterium]|nr:hypothetical protein [Spirochaetota bacterium]
MPIGATPATKPVTIKQKAILNFGLFFLFLFFYLGAALLQTPALKHIAGLTTLGMPFGLLMSLLIFPVSWIIIIIWFLKAK